MAVRKIKPKSSEELFGSEEKKNFPHFSIDTENLPEAKKWEIGEVYKVALVIEQKGIDEKFASFTIKGIEVLPRPPKAKQKKFKREA